MNMKEKLTQALHNAMKSGDNTIKNTVRLVLTNIKLQEVEKGSILEETSIISLVQKEIKSRHEVTEEAKKINRIDIIEANLKEMEILKSFLPEQLSEVKIEEIVKEIIVELNATSISDMGKVMKALLPRLEGKAPNELVSKVVRNLLSG